ncbi:TPA: hypothetical protein L9Q10_002174 [Klebsiella pneumoniae]|uniref:hypothetical protein n=1 Tax=Klebsiella pneumoniae TaxID=573 RepID=UPI0007CC830C|nr:hypothetical protein [Klebsiella pneumoniae]MBY8359659.1 hypothetical protein [Klebsiella pneumoniae]MCL7657868.1 hypothetical protein [Klebsiella pneumoniae]OYI15251.1 hypothetical protein CI697_24115 [Klebsiella pneumoniae subsp. pneumoniae]PLD46803.1 hypothetical protein B6I55_10405 [Klebsiella pneumoniae]SAT45368.1 Uncharacterised protein [Klebsiella pneumoniae]
MKKLLICVVAMLPLAAQAGRITLQLTEQEDTAIGKTLCRYENSIYSFSYVTLSKHCASVKTFDTEDSN